ncbi:MAG: hypothetical protein QM296_02095, partial [Bacillota bacterium]|nr:hypothetical protein [Bacillota bacterium]
MRWCPENGAGAEKLDHGWPKTAVCAPKPGHKPRFLATGGQKKRWCPAHGAGAEKIDHNCAKT